MLDKDIKDHEAGVELLEHRRKQTQAGTFLFMSYTLVLMVLGVLMLESGKGSITLAFISLFVATISAAIGAGYMARSSDYNLLIKLENMCENVYLVEFEEKKKQKIKEVKETKEVKK